MASSRDSSRPRKRSRRRLVLFLIIFATFASSAPLAASAPTNNTLAPHETPQANEHGIVQELECVSPAINEFPEDFFTQEERQNGGIAVHLVITFYLCATLGLVCDRYFVPSLELICEILHVPTDIAGATFMAIGTSAPELFSSVIGSFITEGDIGVGAIVGSAVFNVIGITGLAGLAVWKMSVSIDWYPITRDSFAYLLSIIALIVILNDSKVVWYEAVVLLFMFVLYVLMMVYNSKLEKFSQAKFAFIRSKFGRYRNLGDLDDLEGSKPVQEKTPLLTSKTKYVIVQDPEPDDAETPKDKPKKKKKRVRFENEYCPFEDDNEECLIYGYQTVTKTKPGKDMNGNDVAQPALKKQYDCVWNMPKSNPFHRIFWVLTWPICFLMYLTIPDCRKEECRKYYLLTFTMAVAWIAGMTYLSVWMVTVIGHTFGIPDSISGITLLAVGTSVPEIISSIIVVRNGLGNMAICNLIGSNVFNIVFCLGAPWLLKTTLVSDEGFITINSAALSYMTLTLLSTVVLLYVIFITTKWVLNRQVGFMCILMYIAFIILAVYFELELTTGSLPTCT